MYMLPSSPSPCLLFLMLRRPPRSTLFPSRRSSDLLTVRGGAGPRPALDEAPRPARGAFSWRDGQPQDRKSTRLNSSHRCISYAVFCLKKKNIQTFYSLSCKTTRTLTPSPRPRTLAP